jgi:adenine-specific DNA-methyltransferase
MAETDLISNKGLQTFLTSIDRIRTDHQSSLDRSHQLELGQFFTPAPIATMMAGLFSTLPSEINLLDPGAGIGSLSAAFVAQAITTRPKPKQINVTAFEIDPTLTETLRKTLDYCHVLCQKHNVGFNFDIEQKDFISSSVEIIAGKNSLFTIPHPKYNCAILNPPYKKINSNSKTRHLLTSIGIETTNLYTAFLWLTMRLLEPKSDLVAIVPRSFCNGTYFHQFRVELLKTMAIKQIHLFESRDKAFQDGDVLQENIIIHATKSDIPYAKVTITSSVDPNDTDLVIEKIDFDQLVLPDDPDKFIRIIPNRLSHQIYHQVNGFHTTLKDLGVSVSTGRVVDFRSRDLMRQEADTEVIPLIYPYNFQNGYVQWPNLSRKKPAFLTATDEVNKLVIPAQNYVLVKRFSSKEEKRRIYAAIFDPNRIPAKRIGIENHLNYFYKQYGEISIELARGLTLYLKDRKSVV